MKLDNFLESTTLDQPPGGLNRAKFYHSSLEMDRLNQNFFMKDFDCMLYSNL